MDKGPIGNEEMLCGWERGTDRRDVWRGGRSLRRRRVWRRHPAVSTGTRFQVDVVDHIDSSALLALALPFSPAHSHRPILAMMTVILSPPTAAPIARSLAVSDPLHLGFPHLPHHENEESEDDDSSSQ